MGISEKVVVSNVFRSDSLVRAIMNNRLSTYDLKLSIIDDSRVRVFMKQDILLISGILSCPRFIDAMNYYGVTEKDVHIKIIDGYQGLLKMTFIIEAYGEESVAEISNISECVEDDLDAQNVNNSNL